MIHQQNYDVPLPAFETLGFSESSEACKRSATSFIHLCSLSKLLGDLLPYVYSLKPDYHDTTRAIRRIECSLDEWLANLPAYLKSPSVRNEETANGSSSLYFCLLSMKLLLCRVVFKNAAAAPNASATEEKSYRLVMLRCAASELIEYVSNLSVVQLQEFWLPCKCSLHHIMVLG